MVSADSLKGVVYFPTYICVNPALLIYVLSWLPAFSLSYLMFLVGFPVSYWFCVHKLGTVRMLGLVSVPTMHFGYFCGPLF